MKQAKKVAGTVAYVKDTRASSRFYKELGFEVTRDEADHLSVNVGVVWMDFHPRV